MFGQRADLGERAQLDRPQHLAAVHVADPAHHPLVEQDLGDSRGGVGYRQHEVDDRTEIGVGMAQVRTETAHARMTSPVGFAVGLHDRCVEAHGDQPSTSIDARI